MEQIWQIGNGDNTCISLEQCLEIAGSTYDRNTTYILIISQGHLFVIKTGGWFKQYQTIPVPCHTVTGHRTPSHWGNQYIALYRYITQKY